MTVGLFFGAVVWKTAPAKGPLGAAGLVTGYVIRKMTAAHRRRPPGIGYHLSHGGPARVRHALFALTCCCLLAGSAAAQPAPIKDPLLERLAATWVLRGTLADKQTTHDIVAEWVLGHQYLRILERSREKDAAGQPQYEAIVLIGWDATAGEYQCLWLDSTGGGGLTPQAIARGKRDGDKIPFLFREKDGSVSFNNTFAYDTRSDSWAWIMDNIQNGKAVPFARLRLTRN